MKLTWIFPCEIHVKRTFTKISRKIILCEIHMKKFTWLSLHTNFTWNSCELHMKFTWNFFHMNFTWSSLLYTDIFCQKMNQDTQAEISTKVSFPGVPHCWMRIKQWYLECIWSKHRHILHVFGCDGIVNPL